MMGEQKHLNIMLNKNSKQK